MSTASIFDEDSEALVLVGCGRKIYIAFRAQRFRSRAHKLRVQL